MSRKAKFVVYALDVGPSMTLKTSGLGSFRSRLEAAVSAIGYSLKNKLIHSPREETGLVLFGCDETDNDDFPNVSVAHNIEKVSLDLLRYLEQEVEPGSVKCDFDLLARRKSQRKTAALPNMSLYLFTDQLSTEFDDSLDRVIQLVKDFEVEVVLVGIGEPSADSVIAPNHVSLPDLAAKFGARGRFTPFTDLNAMVHSFRKRAVLPTASFSGSLEIAGSKIAVKAFSKCKRTAFPSLKKRSGLVSLDPSDVESGKVTSETTYHIMEDDQEKEIDKAERVKAYLYGDRKVPFPEVEECVASKFNVAMDKGMKVLCFTPKERVPRNLLTGDGTMVVRSVPGDENSDRALSALCEALIRRQAVAIVSYVYRDKARPRLGVIMPQFLDDDEAGDEEEDAMQEDGDGRTRSQRTPFLMYARLPFAEDVRTYNFENFGKRKQGFVTKEQEAAIDELIDSMDLTAVQDEDGDEVELLCPEDTFNPALQMLYQCLHHRALYPSQPLPPLHPSILKMIEVPEALVKAAAEPLEEIARLFPTEKVAVKAKKTANDLFGDGGQDAATDLLADDAGAGLGFGAAVVTSVGSVNPVADFKALLEKKDADNLASASEQLQQRVEELVSFYVSGDPGELEAMMKVLREEMKADMPNEFNTFLFKLKDLIAQEEERLPLLAVLKTADIKPISITESSLSALSQAQSLSFYAGDEEEAASEPQPSAQADDDDDMLDDL